MSTWPMVLVDDAMNVALEKATAVFESTKTSRVDVIDINNAVGRVLAQDVVASSPHPAFVASIMDGYAYKSDATVEDNFFKLVESACSRAGAPWTDGTLKTSECAYVTTGARVPNGCDTVAPEEECSVRGDVVTITSASARPPGKWTRAVGSDIASGHALLSKRARVSAFDVGILRFESTSVATFRSPTVAVFSTGDEVGVVAGESSKIIDTNAPMLVALCEQEHAQCLFSEIVRDDKSALVSAFTKALADTECDVLITSGGVSMGDRDLVKSVIEELGGEIHFGRLAMKPGKPCTFATIPRMKGDVRPLLVFALPGNPVSAAVTFTLVVAPCLRALSGDINPKPRRIPCEVAHNIQLDAERAEYHRATLDWSGSARLPKATSTGGQISSRLLSMRSADVLLELPKGPGTVSAGSTVSALIISDVRQSSLFAAKLETPSLPSPSLHDASARGAVPLVSVFDDACCDGSMRNLKRAVGLEEDVRRKCREQGSAVDSLSTVYIFSDGASTHVALTETARTDELTRAMTSTLTRLGNASVAKQITRRAYARVGLVGNPSDGYGGKCIAASIANYYAESVLMPTPGTSKIKFVPGPYDGNEYASFEDMATHIEQHGVDGGIRLLKSLCYNIHRYCLDTHQNIDTSRGGFTLSYTSNIPKQTGLSGSSGIIISAMACVIAFYGLDIPKEHRPSLALRVEHDVGINAGPMDRVIQVEGGVVHMDFSQKREPPSKSSGAPLVVHGTYTHLNSSKLPKLYLVWAENPSDSGKTHSTVKQRWNEGDETVRNGMLSCATLCDAYVEALERGAPTARFAEIMNENWNLRRLMFGDSALGELNLKMMQMIRECGCGGKFTGSGGAAIAVCPNGEEQFEILRRACEASGFNIEVVRIAEHSEC